MAALTAEIAGTRLTDPCTVTERVERTCEIIDLARELGAPIVTAAAGALTRPESGEPSEACLAGLRGIGERADARGVLYAVRPSHDKPDRFRGLLDALRCSSLRIGLDPAAIIMSGVSPVAYLERLVDQVVLIHARDATAGLDDRPGCETVFGKGEVDFVAIVASLCGADYRGPYIARRHDSQRPVDDLAAALSSLCQFL
jgi:sugar phosphate isomerase/epimerase